jgi:preprotein translocase subunit SecG
MNLLIGIFTFILILVSLLLVLVVLVQRSRSDGGMGAAIGGGMAESAFGAETGNVLTKTTVNLAVIFFILSFGLYLGHLWTHRQATTDTQRLPAMTSEMGQAPGGEQPVEAIPAEPLPDTSAAEPVSPGQP